MRAMDAKGGNSESYKPAEMADVTRAALASMPKLGASTNGSQTNYPSSDNALVAFAAGTDGAYSTIQRQAAVGLTLQAFQRLAASVESVAGRKSLIWVTDGFPFYVDGDSAEMVGEGSYASYEHTMQTLDNANVAIYPVDARGLVGIQANDNARYATGDVSGTESQVNAMAANHTNTIDTFRDVADMTGGKAFYNRNDIGSLVKPSHGRL